MNDFRFWWTIHLTDGTETHSSATHIGTNPVGPRGPEIVFYADEIGRRVDLRLPIEDVSRIERARPEIDVAERGA